MVICGTAAGRASAAARAYYAGPGNIFWRVLHRVGLTPTELRPECYGSLLSFGVGLTDIAKGVHGRDAEIPKNAYDAARLRAAIQHYRPGILAFNGKNAAKIFLARARVPYGRQAAAIGDTVICVLPSTSAAARAF